MKIFKQITNGLPRVISYIVFYSPLIVIIGLLSNMIPTLYYSFILVGSLVVIMLNLSLLDLIISHHFMNKSIERTLGKITIDEFIPYKIIGIPLKIASPCASYTDNDNQHHSLWINSKYINTKNLKQDQQIELIYSTKLPIIAQISVEWDITQKKHMAENIAHLVLFSIFIIAINWGFIQLISFLGTVIGEF
ncbi:hypothetical protein MNBD_GAMMA12-3516 [hydrothermal vent metagenome]|uniref:Uncharacterized protein n=1 Tax=hydrothermal vent metagenome TaxID=652676 RepID=A0A3B0Y1Q5_9ZZZZ